MPLLLAFHNYPPQMLVSRRPIFPSLVWVYGKATAACGNFSDKPTFPTLQARLFRLTGAGEGSHDRDMERMQSLAKE